MTPHRSAQPRPPHRHLRGFTLVEVLVAVAITTLILAAMVSSALLAGKAVPDPNDAPSAAMTAAQVNDQIAGELETATLILEQTPTAITFVVPPRGSDTNPERIRYSWAGTSGAPLLRQYNRGAATAVISAVDQFSITPVIATSTETYGGQLSEDTTETLLVDDSGTNGLSNQNISSTTWFGQYFLPASFPAGVIGWRPTRVRFQAKVSDPAGVTNVQMQTPDANAAPNGTILYQSTLSGSSLTSSYAWQSFTLSGMPRLTTTSGTCLVLQYASGSSNSAVVQGNNGSGFLKTTNSGSTWSESSTISLQSQIYGTLTHQTAVQTMTSRYLSATGLSLRASRSANPAVQTTAQSLNHPEMLSAFWELKFDRDPGTVDVNADGTPDWTVIPGSTGTSLNLLGLVSVSLSAGSGAEIDSQPGDDFARTTVVDVRYRATGSSGNYGQFSINAARSGSTCAPVLARVTLQSDGTQTVNVWRKLDDSTTDALATIPHLSAQPVDVHLIIDPTYGTVEVTVNNVQYGAFPYNRFASSDSSRSASLTVNGGAEFDYVRIREVMP
jgi:prepilin-type N-terminal cleavage/methylation domain-containing protein